MSAVREREITKDEYDAFKRSRDILSAALAIEELFDILSENYSDAEVTIKKASESYLELEEFTYYAFYELMRIVNIKLINFISIARFYIDNLESNSNEIDRAGLYLRIKKKQSALYDASIEYRVLDQLRNYALHAGTVVHGINGSFLASKNDDINPTVFYASKSRISERSDRIKPKVFAELPETFDLFEYMKSAMIIYRELHSYVTSEISSYVLKARALFEKAIEEAASTLDAKTGIAACVYVGEREKEFTQIFLDWDDVRIMIAEKNRQ
ncbi:hypothetical protein [Phytopseudomonas seleniipraecipitans]|uniref:hypothetical protein n=1 Tax=Phytopseudomonas seleniipraecipitans TaxID=640205 RepID=UPI001428D38D|nr:hypothetical protein [Pseudomonas seleniipraecipitans]